MGAPAVPRTTSSLVMSARPYRRCPQRPGGVGPQRHSGRDQPLTSVSRGRCPP
jgi:hypothetical protein